MANTRLIGMAVKTAIAHRALLKPMAPVAMEVGSTVGKTILRAVLKSFLLSAAVLVLWLGLFAFTYVTMQSVFMANASISIFVAFLMFVLIPFGVGAFETVRSVKKFNQNRAAINAAKRFEAEQAALLAAAEAEAAVVPITSTDAYFTPENISEQVTEQVRYN
jgi:hypothetical protein